LYRYSVAVDTGVALATPQERAAAEADVARNTTPAYRAPEMWDVHRWGKIGRPADVWALGCLLYQLCFTRLPFGQEVGLVNMVESSCPRAPERRLVW
jgi:serine/threonine protein kinase